MTQDREDIIRNCRVCNGSATVAKELLLLTACFTTNARPICLPQIIYSRYPKIVLLASESSRCVIQHFKSLFVRHGIPKMAMSDNEPQYLSQEFKDFASKYQFQRVTSLPKYPRSDGAAECMVQTVKKT